jgi:hypothetical protein
LAPARAEPISALESLPLETISAASDDEALAIAASIVPHAATNGLGSCVSIDRIKGFINVGSALI